MLFINAFLVGLFFSFTNYVQMNSMEEINKYIMYILLQGFHFKKIIMAKN